MCVGGVSLPCTILRNTEKGFRYYIYDVGFYHVELYIQLYKSTLRDNIDLHYFYCLLSPNNYFRRAKHYFEAIEIFSVESTVVCFLKML